MREISLLCLGIFQIFGVSARSPNKVVGGEAAQLGEFPHQVSIHDRGSHICGGAILSSTHILTAAHCFVDENEDIPRPSDLSVIIGVNDYGSRQATKHKVLKYEYHEGYTGKDSDRHDIALITLRDPIVFSESVKAIALPERNCPEGTVVTASGWGAVDWNKGRPIYPKKLQKVDLKVVSNDDCQKSHKTKIYPEQMCLFEAKGKGVCVGDSGGPIIGTDQIHSIVSWGSPCGKGVGDVGTRVWSYLSWIQEAMNSKAPQKKYSFVREKYSQAEMIKSGEPPLRCRYFQC